MTPGRPGSPEWSSPSWERKDRQLDTDVAELLASLAVQIGAAPSGGVRGWLAWTGPAVGAAAAYLQPLALSSGTRARVRAYDRARAVTRSSGWVRRGLRPGGRPSLLGDLRAEIERVTGKAPAKLEPLARFTWKRALALLGAFAVIYLVLPQLANAGAAVKALGQADWSWVLAAVPALFVAQAFSTLVELGAIPAGLPFGPTYIVQFGGSFLNRVTPNNVGGMALNFRYLQKAGVDSGAATGSVWLAGGDWHGRPIWFCWRSSSPKPGATRRCISACTATSGFSWSWPPS